MNKIRAFLKGLLVLIFIFCLSSLFAPAKFSQAQSINLIPPQGSQPEAPSGAPTADEMIDDFEGDMPAGTNGWEYYVGDPTSSSLTCEHDTDTALSGSSSLRIDVNIGANDWGTCSLFYDQPPDFTIYGGVAFDYHAAAQGFLFNFDLTGGTPGARQMYAYTVETVSESVSSWVHVEIPWNHILGVDWEANAGKPINPAEINGFTIGFNTFPDAPNAGTLWIDNLHLIETGPPPPPVVEVQEQPAPEEPESEAEDQAEDAEEEEGGRRRLCPGSTAMIGMVLFFGFFTRVRISRNEQES